MEDLKDPQSTPPLSQAVPLGIQHVLAMFASNVTPAILVAIAAGLAFGSGDMIYLIQMAMVFAGIATLMQTIGFGPVGEAAGDARDEFCFRSGHDSNC